MKTFTEWLKDHPGNPLNWSRGWEAAVDKAVLEWARECYVPDDDVANFSTAVASGEPLDKLAEMVGIQRGPGESDADLRARTERAKEALP